MLLFFLDFFFCALPKQTLHFKVLTISRIPTQISSLRSLTHLKVGYNKITSVPSSLSLLTNLQKLRLLYNNLTALPSSISQLTKLEMIHVAGNSFKNRNLMKNIYATGNTRKYLTNEIGPYFKPLEEVRKKMLLLMWIRTKRKMECGDLGCIPVDLVKQICLEMLEFTQRWVDENVEIEEFDEDDSESMELDLNLFA